jgi:hypothetical protein
MSLPHTRVSATHGHIRYLEKLKIVYQDAYPVVHWFVAIQLLRLELGGHNHGLSSG